MEYEPLYKKIIKTPDWELRWFFYSKLSNTTPDFLVLSKENETDTICSASNIVNVFSQSSNAITIEFSGEPKLYDNSIKIPSKVLKVDIKKLMTRSIKKENKFFKSKHDEN